MSRLAGRLRHARSIGSVALVVLLALALVSCGAAVPSHGRRVASAGPRAFRPGQFWYTRSVSSMRQSFPAGGTVARGGRYHAIGANVRFNLRVSEETWVGVDGTIRERVVVAGARFASAAGRARWLHTRPVVPHSPGFAAAYRRPLPDFNHVWMGWIAHDVIALRAGKFPPGLPYYPSEWTGPGRRDVGDGLLSYRQLVSLPTRPAALRAELMRAGKALARRGGTIGDYGAGPRADAFGELSDIAGLLTSPLPAPERLALFHAAVTMPGARVNRHARDSVGRPGIAVTAFAGAGRLQTFQQLVFDPATGALLEGPNGAVVAQGVVDSAYALPKGVSPLHPAGAPPVPPTVTTSPRAGGSSTVFKVMLPASAGHRSRRPPALDWVLLGTPPDRCFFQGFAEVLRPLRASASIRQGGRRTYVYRLEPPGAHGRTWCRGRYALGVVPDYSARPHAPNPNAAVPDWFSEGERGSWSIFQVS